MPGGARDQAFRGWSERPHCVTRETRHHLESQMTGCRSGQNSPTATGRGKQPSAEMRTTAPCAARPGSSPPGCRSPSARTAWAGAAARRPRRSGGTARRAGSARIWRNARWIITTSVHVELSGDSWSFSVCVLSVHAPTMRMAEQDYRATLVWQQKSKKAPEGRGEARERLYGSDSSRLY